MLHFISLSAYPAIIFFQYHSKILQSIEIRLMDLYLPVSSLLSPLPHFKHKHHVILQT